MSSGAQWTLFALENDQLPAGYLGGLLLTVRETGRSVMMARAVVPKVALAWQL